MLHVTLLEHTPDPERLIAAAAKLCYSPADADTILEGLTPEKTEKFLAMLTEMGHESPVEHAVYTFAVEGVSRSLLAQITRHRIASYSVQSQRYVKIKEGAFAFVTPPEIARDPEADGQYQAFMKQCYETYLSLADRLQARHVQELTAQGVPEKAALRQAEKMAIEDARYVLPNACETKLVVTMNARSLYNFFRLRCCSRAEWEIRVLAWQMLKLCRQVSPTLFAHAGPACVSGPCAEGKMTCGRAEQVRERSRTL